MPRLDCGASGVPGTYVSIPAGRYAVPDTLASLLGEGLRSVAVDAPFCLAAGEIALADFAAYLATEGAEPSAIQTREWRSLSRIAPGRVADAISLSDAQGYAAWLSRGAEWTAALPTPMEWAAAHAYLSSGIVEGGEAVLRSLRDAPREWTAGDCSAAAPGVQSLLMGGQKGMAGLASCSIADKRVPHVGARLILRAAAP